MNLLRKNLENRFLKSPKSPFFLLFGIFSTKNEPRVLFLPGSRKWATSESANQRRLVKAEGATLSPIQISAIVFPRSEQTNYPFLWGSLRGKSGKTTLNIIHMYAIACVSAGNLLPHFPNYLLYVFTLPRIRWPFITATKFDDDDRDIVASSC